MIDLGTRESVYGAGLERSFTLGDICDGGVEMRNSMQIGGDCVGG